MANYKDIFKTTGTQNWFRCALSIEKAKRIIADFVKVEIDKFQITILENVLKSQIISPESKCKSCTTQSVLSCAVTDKCETASNGSCSFHSVESTDCQNHSCKRIAKTIKELHINNTPSWKNTDASRWSESSFEIGKCYCPPGYSNIQSAYDTDLTGLLSIIQNCKHFDSLVSSSFLSALNKVC